MKISYHIFKEKKLLILKYVGKFSVGYFKAFAEEVIQEAALSLLGLHNRGGITEKVLRI